MNGTSIYTITGYTHSDGYCLCPMHANYGNMRDTGNETGKVYPIFLGDEWDTQPTCDVAGCDEEIEVALIDREEEDTEDKRYLIVGIDVWENVDLEEMALLHSGQEDTETSDSFIYCNDCATEQNFDNMTTRHIPHYEAEDEDYVCCECGKKLAA